MTGIVTAATVMILYGFSTSGDNLMRSIIGVEGHMRFILLAVVLLVNLPAASQQTETVYAPGNGITLPVLQKEIRPDYTQEAKDPHIEGTVFLKAVVRADGTAGEVTVERSLDATYGLDDQAVKAVKQWLFTPGKKHGKPVAVRVGVEMTFNLKASRLDRTRAA